MRLREVEKPSAPALTASRTIACIAAISAGSLAAEEKKDIVDTAVAAGNFKTLVAAVQAAGLVDNKVCGFSATHTMRLAQALYEDGAITYMRTDGVQMDGSAISAARNAIAQRYEQSRDELEELFTHLAFYAGLPAAVTAVGYLPPREEVTPCR